MIHQFLVQHAIHAQIHLELNIVVRQFKQLHVHNVLVAVFTAPAQIPKMFAIIILVVGAEILLQKLVPMDVVQFVQKKSVQKKIV
jgi:hypothetical protein